MSEQAKRGRPVLYSDPVELERAAEKYFAQCAEDDKLPTVNGLAVALGMTKMSIGRYRAKPEFADVMEMIYARMGDQWEQRLGGPNAAGAIFWLKNQGWSDRVEQQVSGPSGGPVESKIDVEIRLVNAGEADG